LHFFPEFFALLCMTDRPRLIEVAFPLRQTSLASVNEKNVRQGHISTLHIWPARRPLAACRAALLATLLPDPGDPQKRQELLDQIGGWVDTEPVETVDEEGHRVVEDKEVVKDGVLAWGQENAPAMDSLRAQIREFHGGRAPRVLDPFAGGGAIPLEAMRLGCEATACDLNPVAWFVLKSTLDYPHRFAGQTWPLPDFVRDWPDFIEDYLAGKVKRRKGGQQAHFTDPRQLRLLELPPANLTWHVRAWGRWVLERARQDLASRYPVVGGEPTVAYLWARTARDRAEPFARIPLLKTFWLCKTRGRRSALMPVPAADGMSVDLPLIEESFFSQPENEWSRLLREQFPHLEAWGVDGENLIVFLDRGTMNRAGVWSPCSGRPTTIALTMEDLRWQGQHGLLDTQMTAVVVEHTEIIVREMKNGKQKETRKTRKRYRLPAIADLDAAKVDTEELENTFSDIPFGIPDEPLPPVGTLGFRIPLYGLKSWRDLYNPRQLMALGVFVKHTREAVQQVKKHKPEAAEALAAALGVVFGRFVNYMSMQCIWDSAAGEVKQTFSRFAFPITWDCAEANPLSGADRYYVGGIIYAALAIESLMHATKPSPVPPDIRCESSIVSVHAGNDVVFTDPPYYDAIPYSDLMDFFFVWQKRIVGDLNDTFRRVYERQLAPKWDNATEDGELIEDESRHGGDKAKAKQAYEDGMAKAFMRSAESLNEDGRYVIVFANQEVDAWETLVSAIVRAGFVVTASWPIQTEMRGGFRNHNRASLGSSVWLVCRKRPKAAQPGWDEHVLDAMKAKLFDPRPELGNVSILQYYFDQNIIGPDFLWAALGPALEAYSAHPFVRKADGSGAMTVSDFLREVRKLVLQFALGRLLGAEGLDLDAVTQFYLLHRSTFGVEPAPASACILYAMSCGKNLGELQMVWHVLTQGGKKRGRPLKLENSETDATAGNEPTEGKGNELVLVDWLERGRADDVGEPKAGHPSPLIDRVQKLLFLLHQGRTSDVQQLFNQWALASEPAFKPLLQALRELALRDKQNLECRMVEALATTLNMNTRRVVTPEGVVQETPMFESLEAELPASSPVRYSPK
jgi:putative DNA methylase